MTHRHQLAPPCRDVLDFVGHCDPVHVGFLQRHSDQYLVVDELHQRRTHLLEHILLNLGRLSLSNLYSTNMQRINDVLNLFSSSSWRGSESDDAEVRVEGLQVGDALDVGVVTGCFVCFVCYEQRKVSWMIRHITGQSWRTHL